MSDSDSPQDQLAALWERGVALDAAWIEFARFFDRFAYQALRTYPANDSDVLAPHPRYKELQGWLPKTWEGRKEKLLVTTRNERFHLLDELYDGVLWAIGFRTLPNGSDELVRIPRRYFLFAEGVAPPDVHIDWARAEVRDGSTCYFDIRVVKPPVVENESAEAPPPDQGSALTEAESTPDNARAMHLSPVEEAKPSQPGPRGGRPNRRDEIRGKVKELWEDPLFRAIPNRTDQAREVRTRLCGENARHLDDMQGYRTTQIKRIIGEVANKPTET
jgi:hypothetical protein